MYSLFIDTHDFNIVLALYKDGCYLSSKIMYSEKNHSDFIMPLLKELLDNSNMSVHDLNEIIVDNGPGSFTGVRLGVTIAKTLAYTLKIPIKTISSLEIFMLSSNKNAEIKVVKIDDLKGSYVGVFKDEKSIMDFEYLSKSDFTNFIETNNYFDNIVSNEKYDFDRIYEYSKSIKEKNAHSVNPIYVKVIEALKND